MAKQELTLEQKQTQRMALEQQRMLGQMLEKNDAEMTEFIDNKVNENQALEKKNDEDDEMGGSEPDRDTNARNNDAANDMVGVDNGDDDTMAWYRYFANNRSTDDEYHGPTAVSEKTMQEVLLDQLREMELDETQQIIAQTIVGNIEDNGYLRRSAAEIADDVTFNDGYYVNADQVEEMIGVVQTLDPAGIAARDVRECILLQLQRKPQSEQVKIATAIIDKYFDELAAMRLDTIARRMDLDKGVVENVVKNHIRRGINPYPGNAFSSRSDAIQQVTPDFDVELDEDSGRLTVTLRNNIPALQISESFALMNERYKRAGSELSVKEAKEKKQIQDAYQRASMFIELLRQRQETLFNTMNAIVKCQRDYFLSGDERDLKPLGQQQIADMIGKDVSVVSRAVNNKYVQLPWGVKSLRSFFSEGINGASRHEVYDDLKKLVDGEDKAHPL
ncbi:MAG: hypothetical protein IJS04_05570, partial [Muribaculaceae bacterium]|nr:hypothetical protein [Muribaculaceae bacterium]